MHFEVDKEVEKAKMIQDLFSIWRSDDFKKQLEQFDVKRFRNMFTEDGECCFFIKPDPDDYPVYFRKLTLDERGEAHRFGMMQFPGESSPANLFAEWITRESFFGLLAEAVLHHKNEEVIPPEWARSRLIDEIRSFRSS